MRLALEALFWAAVTFFTAWGWASLCVWIAGPPTQCTCSRHRLCSACLAASEAIRPTGKETA